MPAPIVAEVRRFVETEVRPCAAALEHADAYPHALVARMRALGLFGALVPREHGGLGLDVADYARVIEELCRGWMSLAGVINSHTMAALIVLQHGTDEQRRRFLPRFAAGDARGGLCLTEPHAGSDVQAIRTTARRAGDAYVLDGTKMFVTNGREGNTFALLALTDPRARPAHRGMSCFIVEAGRPGFRVAKSLAKLGYKGVDTVELVLEECAVPAANLVGGVEGRGFAQVMSGLETGRINIAARCVGVAQAALEAAVEWARARGGEPPAALADMAAGVAAARLVTAWAAGMKDRRERCDLEAGMAKLFASETAHAVAVAGMRVHGEAGTLERLDAERHYRDTPLMIIGEGTNEIQRILIARQLVDRHGERPGALTSREGESEERRQLVLAVRQFVDKTLAPAVAGWDVVRHWPAPVVAELAGLGLLGAVVAPRFGGLGLDLVTTTMLLEELARGWTTLAAGIGSHLTATWALDRFASEPERAAWLPPMTRGERLGTVAPGEVRAGWDGGGWRLDGSTRLADNAPRAGLFLVEAALDGRRAVALLERDTPGLRVGEPEPALGARGLDPAPLALTGARATPGRLLGDEAAAGVRAVAALAAAAVGVGLAQAAFEAALRYAQQRTTFGKPIAQHQAVQLKLADMATAITAARLLAGHAAASAGEAGAPDPGLAAMARLQAAAVAGHTTLEAMRIHGGYGYVSEFPVERYYRDAARLAFVPVDDDALRREVARRLLGPFRSAGDGV